MKWIRHVVGEFDMEEGTQRCIICGEAIVDYRNTMSPKGSPPPSGYVPGNVYMSTGNPRQTVSGALFERGDTDFAPCNQ